MAKRQTKTAAKTKSTTRKRRTKKIEKQANTPIFEVKEPLQKPEEMPESVPVLNLGGILEPEQETQTKGKIEIPIDAENKEFFNIVKMPKRCIIIYRGKKSIEMAKKTVNENIDKINSVYYNNGHNGLIFSPDQEKDINKVIEMKSEICLNFLPEYYEK